MKGMMVFFATLVCAVMLSGTAFAATCPVSSVQVKDNLNNTANMAVSDDGTGSGNCITYGEQLTVNAVTSQYPAGTTPITTSATGTTAATTATLAATGSKTTYICGFSIRANATAAATGNSTVSGTVTGTMNFTQWTAPNGAGLGVTEEIFQPCIPASATNTTISVISAAPSTGGVVSVSAWGFQQ